MAQKNKKTTPKTKVHSNRARIIFVGLKKEISLGGGRTITLPVSMLNPSKGGSIAALLGVSPVNHGA